MSTEPFRDEQEASANPSTAAADAPVEQGDAHAEPSRLRDPETNFVVEIYNISKVDRTLYIVAVISFVLSTLSNLRYNFGRRSPWDDGHQDDVSFTPFTANAAAIFLYWIVVITAQFVYLWRFFNSTPRGLSLIFIVSNTLSLFWSYLFSRGHYFISETVVIVNTFQLLVGYILVGSYRLRPLANWIAIHGAIIVGPLVWNHYLVFWNGAVLFGARNLPSRLIANALIWEFLFVPGVIFFIFGDYLFGFASAWIAFAIGLGQLLTKVFALQWIFAFTIGTILLLSSLVLAFVSPSDQYSPPALSELRQATNGTDETAPLLTEP